MDRLRDERISSPLNCIASDVVLVILSLTRLRINYDSQLVPALVTLVPRCLTFDSEDLTTTAQKLQRHYRYIRQLTLQTVAIGESVTRHCTLYFIPEFAYM